MSVAGAWTGWVCGFCVFAADCSIRLFVRLEELRRPKTHDIRARVQRWQAPEPSGTEHFSFWARHRSHDSLRDSDELSPGLASV
jgi:hypothetical protein